MDIDTFSVWYAGLKSLGILDDVTSDVVKFCVHEKKCTTCKLRGRCPIRPAFYLDDQDFELELQNSELLATDLMSLVADIDVTEESFISAEKLRQKREAELLEHKVYSFN